MKKETKETLVGSIIFLLILLYLLAVLWALGYSDFLLYVYWKILLIASVIIAVRGYNSEKRGERIISYILCPVLFLVPNKVKKDIKEADLKYNTTKKT